MAIILNIDTAVDTASVCLSSDSGILKLAVNSSAKNHAAWLHPSIQQLMKEAGLEMSQLDAIAVTTGPGSYTGLRVGLAAVKGLCFALNKPLISVSTLEMMAVATRLQKDQSLLCPLIDARRMEVFTAVFDQNLTQIIEPKAMIIDENSFSELLTDKAIIFSGNGCEKVKKIIRDPNAFFSNVQASSADMIMLSERYYKEKNFADIAYVEPLYLKEFYTIMR
jgi:tRNA threonylcarbamoyladenosine biosynthesis protein TsaB